MFLILFLIFLSFPPQWEKFLEGLNKEKEDIEGAIEIYKELEKSLGQIGILSNYKLIILDEKYSYDWFQKILNKKTPKKMLEETYEILIQRKNKDAINSFEKLKKKFSVKFRKKIEEKIFLIRFEENKYDKNLILKEAVKKNERAAISIGKLFLKNNINILNPLLIELFKIGVKYRDLELCDLIVEKNIKNKDLEKNDKFLLGRYYFFKKEYNKSIEYFDMLKDDKALFHKARILLLQNEEEKALEILKIIKNELFSEAQYLISRIHLKNGNLKDAEDEINKIKKISLKRQAILNLAIHYNFYGKKEEAKSLLNKIKENSEVNFWKKNIDGKIELNFSPENAPFNFFFLSKFPDFQKEDPPLNLNFKPINFLQFLISKGFFKEGLFFENTTKFDPKFLSKIYLSQKKYKEAVNTIHKEASLILKKDTSEWNPSVLRLYFPNAYEEKAKVLCKEYGVPLNLFWAIMRQESMFQEDAISNEGALGIMQVLPQNYLKYGEDLENPFDIEKNMRVSLKYLNELKETFGNWVYTIAAYNAGEDAVSLWLKDPITIDLPSFYSTIPYYETKNYLRNVLYNWMIYRILYGDEYEKD